MTSENLQPVVADMPAQRQQALKWVQRASDLMDNRFRIPGTQIRFGLDAIIGLVPYVGDVAGFVMSGIMVFIMARYGASGMLVLRMLGNVLLDALVGAVPLLGDIFDIAFKANRRNLRLLQEHYGEGKHQGSAWWFVGLVLALFVIMAFAMFFILYKFIVALGLWLWGFFS